MNFLSLSTRPLYYNAHGTMVIKGPMNLTKEIINYFIKNYGHKTLSNTLASAQMLCCFKNVYSVQYYF